MIYCMCAARLKEVMLTIQINTVVAQLAAHVRRVEVIVIPSIHVLIHVAHCRPFSSMYTHWKVPA